MLSIFNTTLEKTAHALGRLDGISSLLPDINSFLRVHVTKEALLSSQIEGIHASFLDILKTEISRFTRVYSDDIQEVVNCIAAMNRGLSLIENGLPFSVRLIKSVHETLMQSGRGSDLLPGEFRNTQNWLGGSRPCRASYVPPPPECVPGLMSELERFVHERDEKLTPLIRIGIVHAQFETIHPFLDGNGRTGRMLITLMLCMEKKLTSPLIYPSLFFKSNRQQYYERLGRIRTHGEWENWISFYLKGVSESSKNAAESIQQILILFERDLDRVQGANSRTQTPELVFKQFQQFPVADVDALCGRLNMSAPAIRRAIGVLERLGIIKETTGQKRGRLYVYADYFDILEKGTEPLSEIV